MSDDPAQNNPLTAEIVEVGVEQAGQRIDNFLIKYMKGVPKTRLYRALRGGEVRVNGARKKAPYQLCVGDKLRIPPIRRSARIGAPSIPDSLLDKIPVLFEDRCLLVVDKPAGLAAHGGTGMDYGLIEALRKLRADLPYLELAHRLDRETSGCLMLAKSRAALLALHEQLGERSVGKNYVALVKGVWRGGAQAVDIPLPRPSPRHQPDGGEKKAARSVFSPKLALPQCTLVDIRLVTGRMHQARLHAAGTSHPIAGDRLYGEREFNRRMKNAGLGRLFLHAERLRFNHPLSGAPMEVCAELPAPLEKVLDNLRATASPGDSPSDSPDDSPTSESAVSRG